MSQKKYCIMFMLSCTFEASCEGPFRISWEKKWASLYTTVEFQWKPVISKEIFDYLLIYTVLNSNGTVQSDIFIDSGT
jgi:hypothetical protein